MTPAASLVLATVVLAAGTLAFRLTGSALRARITLSPRVERLMTLSVVVLFAALIATSTVLQGNNFAGFARPAGVAVAAVLAWRKLPFVGVVLAAAATTAVLRLLGVP